MRKGQRTEASILHGFLQNLKKRKVNWYFAAEALTAVICANNRPSPPEKRALHQRFVLFFPPFSFPQLCYYKAECQYNDRVVCLWILCLMPIQQSGPL